MPPDLSTIQSSKTPILPPISNRGNVVVSSARARIRSPVNTSSPELKGEQSVTDVHAQRIVTVLNEAIAKVDILMSLPPQIESKAQRGLGLDLCQEIEKLNKLSRIIDAKDFENADAILNSLQDSVRQVCRTIIHDPEKYSQICKLATQADHSHEKTPELQAFQQILESCKSLTIDKYVKSTQDEESKKLELQCILDREKKISDEVESLKVQVKDAELNSFNEINAKNEIIRKLKDELRSIKHAAEEVSRKLESRPNLNSHPDKLNEIEQGLQAEIKTLQVQLAQEIAKHREEEQSLRKRRFKVETEVEAWVSKYDQEMIERQAELDELMAVYRLEKTQSDELHAKFRTLQQEHTKIVEEQKWQELVKAKLDAERLHRVTCSTKIQAVWRGHRARKQLKEAAAKKKPKSAKGTKKKKK